MELQYNMSRGRAITMAKRSKLEVVIIKTKQGYHEVLRDLVKHNDILESVKIEGNKVIIRDKNGKITDKIDSVAKKEKAQVKTTTTKKEPESVDDKEEKQ